MQVTNRYRAGKGPSATGRPFPFDRTGAPPADAAANHQTQEGTVCRDSTIVQRIRRHRETGLALILLLIGVFLSIFSKNFLSSDNLFNVLKQTTLVAIIAIGQTFVVITAGVDLSVGYSMTLCSMILAYGLKANIPMPIMLVLSVLCSVAVGAANGVLITKLHIAPFIITLGMANIVKGIIPIMSQGYIVSLKDPFNIWLGQGNIGPVPVMVILFAIFTFILNQTVFGNQVKAIGGNVTAASLSGIHSDRIRITVYTICDLVCGIAGLIVTGRLNGGNPNAAGTYDMDSMAAVIVGGTFMSGGAGSIIGTLLGALLMILIRNGLVLLRVNMYWQTVAIGAVIIAVCAIDSIGQRKK